MTPADLKRHLLLKKLAEVAPTDPRIQERLKRLEEAIPELASTSVDSSADPLHATERPGPSSPLSSDELLESDPSDEDILAWILSYEDPGWHRNREGLLGAVEMASARDFAWSARLVEALRSRGASNSDVATRVLRSWATRPDWKTDEWQVAIPLLEALSPESDALSIADLLEHGLSGQSGDAIPVALLDQAESVAIPLLERDEDTPDASTDDWLTLAINHTGGKVALFLLRSLSVRLKNEQVVVGSLPDATESLLTSIAQAASPSEELARVVLASQIHFIDQFSPDWIDENLLPAFDWSTPSTAVQVWHGYLSWGRITPRLAAELIGMYLQCVANRSFLPSVLQHRLFTHLARIAFMPRGPSRDWLGRLVALDDSDALALWSRAVAFELRNLPLEARQAAWDQWLAAYWSERIRGIPRPISPAEASEQGAWPILLPFAFADAVDHALGVEAAGLHGLFFSDIRSTALPDSSPRDVAKLVAHLTAQHETPFYSCTDAIDLWRRLRASLEASEPELLQLREALLRLGCDPGD